MENKQEKLTSEELLKRFSNITNMSLEEAQNVVGAENEEEILKNIKEYNKQKIYERMPKLNRAQRRALAKKTGNKQLSKSIVSEVSETAEKLNYINLIQQLRELNDKKEKEIEEYEDANEND